MDIQIKQVETPDIFKNRHRQVTVYYPREIEQHIGFTGCLYGYYHSATNSFNVVAVGEEQIYDTALPLKEIGRIFPQKPSEYDLSNLETQKSALLAGGPLVLVDGELVASCYLCAYWKSGELIFEVKSECCKKEPYCLKMDVFSRNAGILETDIMLEKGALIIGCGSGGGLTALELARAGVGRFLLVDSDILGYNNICRHQCGISDVGKYKTDAVKERILQINPQASVEVQHCLMQEVSPSILDNFCNADTVIVEGADNRASGLYANKIAMDLNIPFVSIGCWERASAGEIFYWLPFPTGMPDYKNLIAVSSDISGRINQNRQFYTTEEDLAKTVFEPGISADIAFVAIIAVKLIIDILNRDNSEYTPRLLNHLTQYTLICNTNDEKIGGKRVAIFTHPLQVTTSIQIAIDEPSLI
jgi:molybdopterin/thiamine biosynthesis adenylyltransferase